MQVFDHDLSKREENDFWSEDPIREPENYDIKQTKRQGVVGLSNQDTAELPPVDTIVADLAMQKLEMVGDGNREDPVFLAVGFLRLACVCMRVCV